MLSKFLVLSVALVLTEFLPLVRSEEVTKNISCAEIKDKAGHYHYSYEAPSATKEIEINENGNAFCLGQFGNLSLSDDVVDCDEKSIITYACRNVTVKFIQYQEGKVSESYLYFHAIEEPTAVHSSTPLGLIVGLTLGALVFCLCVAAGVWYVRKRNRERGLNSTLQGRHQDQRDAKEDNRCNIEQEQEECLLEEKCNSANTNGRDIQVSINMEEMDTTKEDINGVTQVNGALPRDGLDGMKRFDPGGREADTEADTGLFGTKHPLNGQTFGGQISGYDKDREEDSPGSHGSAGPGFEETAGGQGQALVDRLGPGNDCTALSEIQGEALAMALET